MILICTVGMEWESKAQNFLIAIIVGAMVDFIVGTIVGPQNDLQLAQGFTGFNGWFSSFFASLKCMVLSFVATIWEQNWQPQYRATEGQEYNFMAVFAIFFPSVTGIQAGANISGDLKVSFDSSIRSILVGVSFQISSKSNGTILMCVPWERRIF